MTEETSQHSTSRTQVQEKKAVSDTGLNGQMYRIFVTPPPDPSPADPSPINKAWAIFQTGEAQWSSAEPAVQSSIFIEYTQALAALPLENPVEDKKDSKEQTTQFQQYKNLSAKEKQQYINMQLTYISASYQLNEHNKEFLYGTYQRCKAMLILAPGNEHLIVWKRDLAITIQRLATDIEVVSDCGCC